MLRLVPVIMILAVVVLVGCSTNSTPTDNSTNTDGDSGQVSEVTLPKGIYPDSMSRLPMVKREDLDEDGKRIYDLISDDESRSLGGFTGPRGVRINSPRVAEAYTAANQYLRNEAGIDPRLRELAILVAARAMDNAYEWTAHESSAQKEGLEQSIIDIVKYRKPLTAPGEIEGLGEREAVIIQLGREALGEHKVSSDTFARALKQFGKQGLVNVVSLMAHYTATAIVLTTFDQHLRPGQKSLLPLP